jgi:Collagen triple helix repeat (20 copies)
MYRFQPPIHKTFILSSLLFLIFPAWAFAQSVQLPIQGFLTDNTDQAIDGTEKIEIAIYDESVAGARLFQEFQDVNVEDGFFVATAGRDVPLDALLFRDDEIFLSISINGRELLPRTHLPPTPYALIAENVVGDIEPMSVSVDGSVVIDSSGQWVGDIAGLQGEKGDPGLQGEKGDKGDPGLQGDKGDRGDPGRQGEKGDRGDPGLDGEKGDRGDPGIDGEKGDRGDPGIDGEKGDRGDPGIDGEKGDRGDPGIDGEKGDRGDPGIDGEKGDRGDPGIDGEKGDRGDPGIDGQSGLVSVTYEAGMGAAPNGSDVYVFVSPTARTAVTKEETAIVTATATIGTTFSGGTVPLEFAVCYAEVFDFGQRGSPMIIRDGDGIDDDDIRGISLARATLRTFTLSAATSTSLKGEYDFGLCAREGTANASGDARWDDADHGSVTVLVAQVR